MRINIFRQELRMLFKSVITWSVSIVALIGVFGSLYSGFAADAELLNQMMAKFPPQLLAAFGMTGVDLSTVPGYFGLIFLFVQICLAIQAANYGFSLVSIEEREWTADFLLAKPVGRTQILTSKLLAAVSALAITEIVLWISTFGFIQVFKGDRTYDAGPMVLLLLGCAVFQLFFLTVGLEWRPFGRSVSLVAEAGVQAFVFTTETAYTQSPDMLVATPVKIGLSVNF